MSHRFFSEEPIDFTPEGPNVVRLAGPEAHHLTHVMRLKTGERLTLFDGSGHEYRAELQEVFKRNATLTVLSREAVDRESPVALTLGVAMPKGDRQKVLVEKLTELGVTELVPLRTDHSVVALKAAAIEKLRRLVIEASKQCGRNRLMAIADPAPLDDFLASSAAESRWLAHPTGEPWPSAGGAAPASVAVAVGPEGGFSAAETAVAAEAGWRAVSLGPRILRIETAAIALAARATAAHPA